MQPKLKITGQKELFKKLAQFGEEAERMIDIDTKNTAEDIAEGAKQKVPVNFGKLKQSINVKKEEHLFYTVNVNEKYGAYVEFGTGVKVSVPAEFQDIASAFQNERGGGFDEMLESIKVWCRAKGIPEDRAYIIAMNLIKEGQSPQPYLYPAYVRGKSLYKRMLENTLETLTKKHSK